ncbi:excalibur calcium-binding domain-containing protein [Qipengyuania sp. GH29]|nr:excalibur calcium-binding domain-containing protein [Qipengyuania sphaerica]
MVLVVMLGLFIWNLSTTPGNILFESEEETAARLAIERSVTYEGCNEVRAQGKAPLYRGQPGYGEHMDGDGDGIACEPYR